MKVYESRIEVLADGRVRWDAWCRPSAVEALGRIGLGTVPTIDIAAVEAARCIMWHKEANR